MATTRNAVYSVGGYDAGKPAGGIVSDATVTLSADAVVSDALLTKLTAALADLDTLIGTQADPAGTTSLRAIKNQTNATINAGPAPYVKALADGLITVARALKRDIRLDLQTFDSAD